MIVANMIFWIASGYVWCGIAVAVAFLVFGLDRIDASANGAYAFRPLLLPGLALLWPIVILRWVALSRRAS